MQSRTSGVTEHNDIYSFNLNFEELPFEIPDIFHDQMEETLFRTMEMYHEIQTEAWINNELEEIKRHYDISNSKNEFSDEDLYNMVIKDNFDYLVNSHFYEALIEKLKRDIKGFKINDFYERLAC
ncbi:hypothetical protein EI546_03330 [Aequorivita sp. H23M31]|uniref:Uncharacterized protein n=1 Tax=Aequorivita ciconiae TaxID=2494375 RepID=A0A410G0L8_9FLAO|nr:hypothetical protein [Aequorivita sp. H23M31]QAA80818.1 hypothetical protein EI546_03330 [Aequorivita sp. H23M31]